MEGSFLWWNSSWELRSKSMTLILAKFNALSDSRRFSNFSGRKLVPYASCYKVLFSSRFFAIWRRFFHMRSLHMTNAIEQLMRWPASPPTRPIDRDTDLLANFQRSSRSRFLLTSHKTSLCSFSLLQDLRNGVFVLKLENNWLHLQIVSLSQVCFYSQTCWHTHTHTLFSWVSSSIVIKNMSSYFVSPGKNSDLQRSECQRHHALCDGWTCTTSHSLAFSEWL